MVQVNVMYLASNNTWNLHLHNERNLFILIEISKDLLWM